MATVTLSNGSTIESDDNDGQGWTCDYEDDDGECSKWFATTFSFGRHKKSHEKRTCGRCGQPISKNGHTQHERRCAGRKEEPGVEEPEQPKGVPWPAMKDRYDDITSMMTDNLNHGCVLVVTPMNAVFMNAVHAHRHAVDLLRQGTPAMLVPSALVEPPRQAARWRRISPDIAPPAPLPKPKPAPPVKACKSPALVGLAAWAMT